MEYETDLDGVESTLCDDLKKSIRLHSKMTIAGESFSIYAFEALKEELAKLDEFRFLFTSPTFTTERAAKEKREFYIPRLHRERNLYADALEIKLRNELTQRAIARECALWIQERAKFQSVREGEFKNQFAAIDRDVFYQPVRDFTLETLGCDRSGDAPIISRNQNPVAYLKRFDAFWNDPKRVQDVTDEILENIAAAYKENAPDFIYLLAIHHIFSEFLENLSEDLLPDDRKGLKNTKIWDMLYDFQRDAALAIIHKLEEFNGCILADSVGLGKTFTALAVIKYYELRHKDVLVLCPKRLGENWNLYRNPYDSNILYKDGFRYKVLYHTDLSRKRGVSNGLDLAQLAWQNFDLIVIDESHNFRNGANARQNDEEATGNRYRNLLERAIKPGSKTKVLMLSATPVNNRFGDLKNQLELACEGDSRVLDAKLQADSTVAEIFRQAQAAFNKWSKLEPKERTTDRLLRELDFDFFKLLDAVTIARSRKHVARYYEQGRNVKFPNRLQPKSFEPKLSTLPRFVEYDFVFDALAKINLEVYVPSKYILPEHRQKYAKLFHDEDINVKFTQMNREFGLRQLMATNLLKRMESSVHSFRATLQKICKRMENALERIREFERDPSKTFNASAPGFDVRDFDEDDQSDDLFESNRAVEINIADMDWQAWRDALEDDAAIAQELLAQMSAVEPDVDGKLQQLLKFLDEKIANPFNPGNRKLLIFTAFADTAEYLFEHVGKYVKERYGLETALIAGAKGRSTVPRLRNDLDVLLTCFSPISKMKSATAPDVDASIDVLIATDCVSEGQNLQDCDCVVNYDVHWNPVRIVQRFGRVDRIGSLNDKIQLVTFWPDVSLDEYIKLKEKVETRMKIANLVATGDDNPLDAAEIADLQFRREQLERLRTEAVDLEEISGGVSITDLGLNEYRVDLLERRGEGIEVERAPKGLHAVVKGDKPGFLFVLRNVNRKVNPKNLNRLHPYYLVYVGADGKIVSDCFHAKETLDYLRALARGKTAPDLALCKIFNRRTEDGRKMDKASKALQIAAESIMQVKKERDVDSIFTPGPSTIFTNEIAGLDDFELICFLAVM